MIIKMVIFFLSSVINNEDDLFRQSHEHGTKKTSESPTGIEPMASQIPVGRSNQLSYKRLVESLAIY